MFKELSQIRVTVMVGHKCGWLGCLLSADVEIKSKTVVRRAAWLGRSETGACKYSIIIKIIDTGMNHCTGCVEEGIN